MDAYLNGELFNRDSLLRVGYYTLDNGLLQMRYAFATAVDLFQSCVFSLLCCCFWLIGELRK